jgi:two-component system response regulator RegX3
VLVVEDEARLRDLIRSFLESEGLVVMTTGSGAEAISMAAKSPPDLVVLDLGLPDVPGLEVSKELRRNSDVPVLMVTAKVSAEDLILGLELGADDYLTKPFSPRELVLLALAILRPGSSGSSPVPPGRVYSRYELVNAVSHDWEGYERVIDSHVKNLRRKLGVL